jgi:predicted 3-demethylubiquinone-9 3-methyltransferase (glyoxalase superfamily)
MFQDKAEEAMRFYVSLFPDAQVLELTRYGPNQPGTEGSVMKASFTIGKQTILCLDSAVKHDFTFTPAFSLFVDCESEEQIKHLYGELSAGGATFMPVQNYGFRRLFAWLSDRFGVSWQVNLP